MNADIDRCRLIRNIRDRPINRPTNQSVDHKLGLLVSVLSAFDGVINDKWHER